MGRVDHECAGHIHIEAAAGKSRSGDQARGEPENADGSIHRTGTAQKIQRPQNECRACGEDAKLGQRLISLSAQDEHIMAHGA